MRATVEDGHPCTEKEINTFLSKFNRIDSLNKICSPNFKHNLDYCCPDIALRLVKFSDDNSQRYMSINEVELSKRMSHYVFQEKINGLDKDEGLLMMDYQQHKHNESLKYALARTYCFYEKLWNKIEQPNSIKIEEDINELTCLDLTTLIALNFAFANQVKEKGYFSFYSQNIINTLDVVNRKNFCLSNQRKFIVFCSINIDSLKNKDSIDTFNLELLPAIESNIIPNGCTTTPYLVPSFDFFIKKATTNLYFSLSKKYESKKGNAFKTAFGFVFETYVGNLFEECLNSWIIKDDSIYNKSWNHGKIDFFLYKEKKLILVEVKQASLYLNATKTCNRYIIKKDLKQTLNKGVEQIIKTEQYIQEKKFTPFPEIYEADTIQRLVVTYLPLKSANSIIKPIIKDTLKSYPNNKDFHIINIHELEMLLSIQKESESLFELLNYKELEYPNVEFLDYFASNHNGFNYKIDFLENINKEFNAIFGLT